MKIIRKEEKPQPHMFVRAMINGRPFSIESHKESTKAHVFIKIYVCTADISLLGSLFDQHQYVLVIDLENGRLQTMKQDVLVNPLEFEFTVWKKFD